MFVCLVIVPSTDRFCQFSLQTQVYALYAVPTIVSAAILLTTRHLNLPLPHAWWELFDAEWEDVWSVCGYIMRLYRERTAAEKMRVVGMAGKKEVRKWLADNGLDISK